MHDVAAVLSVHVRCDGLGAGWCYREEGGREGRKEGVREMARKMLGEDERTSGQAGAISLGCHPGLTLHLSLYRHISKSASSLLCHPLPLSLSLSESLITHYGH